MAAHVLHLPEKPVALENERGNDLFSLRSFDGHLHEACFFHGPLLLGADRNWNDELPDHIIYRAAKDYHYELPQSQEFSIANTHYKIPAQFQQNTSEVILVPIAEFTHYGCWNEQFAGFVRNGSAPIERPRVQIRQLVKVLK